LATNNINAASTMMKDLVALIAGRFMAISFLDLSDCTEEEFLIPVDGFHFLDKARDGV
jgi:hypothetical protein